MEGDFTKLQEDPLSLPPSLVRLELYAFRDELGPAPSGLRELYLCASGSSGVIPHPLLTDRADFNRDDARQTFYQEAAKIIRPALPTLRVLHVGGLHADEPYSLIPSRACIQALHDLPHPHLEELCLYDWELHWEDVLPLLSPGVTTVQIKNCLFAPDHPPSDRVIIPPLPQGVASLKVSSCCCNYDIVAFSRLPDTLRHLDVEIGDMVVEVEQPLPTLLDSFTWISEGNIIVTGRMLPAGLRMLDLWGDFDQPLVDLLPGLRVLKLGLYEHPLPQLPDTLETPVLDGCTHHITTLPAGLRSLSVYWQPPFHAPRLPLRAAA
ncbi:hypothetical protein JKP88DRAFT_322303 [Tribonema minus]|uniref:Uncharacterized protein n=1 Tax=Tribonema minus TaxID=303371 RepID=A0A835Z2P3_9STRA|nr:hypothetical protein JKP88DRAFT_322303 [Tribonema minus]